MNNICSRCNWEIVALSLSDEQKNEILELLTSLTLVGSRYSRSLNASKYLGRRINIYIKETIGLMD